MDSVDLKTTRLLTEHLGYQPIAVIDDIINVINEIMYRSTEQLEQILITQQVKTDKDNVGRIQEIKTGTATLESFLEHTINTNFDKFEVYALRNVFTIPPELVAGGYVRLKHHRMLSLDDGDVGEKDAQVTQDILDTVREINYQIKLNEELNGCVARLSTLLKLSRRIRMKLRPFTLTPGSSTQEKKLLAQISPLNNSLRFLITQVRSTYEKLNKTKGLLADSSLVERFTAGPREEQELHDRINVLLSRTHAKAARPSSSSLLAALPPDEAERLADFFTGDAVAGP